MSLCKHWGLPGVYMGQPCLYCVPEPEPSVDDRMVPLRDGKDMLDALADGMVVRCFTDELWRMSAAGLLQYSGPNPFQRGGVMWFPWSGKGEWFDQLVAEHYARIMPEDQHHAA